MRLRINAETVAVKRQCKSNMKTLNLKNELNRSTSTALSRIFKAANQSTLILGFKHNDLEAT